MVLLAESHVYTFERELHHTLCEPSNLPGNLPRGFVRLVYCLGYGEDLCLDEPVFSPRNLGTPQFWKVFYSCVNPVSGNEDFAAVQVSRTPDRQKRLRNKLRLLETLQSRRIWLVDASIAALYRPGQPRPPQNFVNTLIQESWDGYTGKLVADTDAQAILCIGKGVAQALRLASIISAFHGRPSRNQMLAFRQRIICEYLPTITPYVWILVL